MGEREPWDCTTIPLWPLQSSPTSTTLHYKGQHVERRVPFRTFLSTGGKRGQVHCGLLDVPTAAFFSHQVTTLCLAKEEEPVPGGLDGEDRQLADEAKEPCWMSLDIKQDKPSPPLQLPYTQLFHSDQAQGTSWVFITSVLTHTCSDCKGLGISRASRHCHSSRS